MNPRWRLNLDREFFLQHYWQRRPLLIKCAINAFEPPVNGDDLAGLAMEDNVEARIIEKHGETWRLEHGPFAESAYQRTAPWTLLVQSVDHYVADVEELRSAIDFIPRWRVDDVMVSYAVDGGSVGPHYDNYDVFLLQGQGERLWRLGQHCDSSSGLLPHDELRILDQFTTQEEFLLECGDILYVPPGVAHWGIARGECTTFSIGFRAPRIVDMVSRWADHLLERISVEEFYRDPKRSAAHHAGEITTADLQRVRQQLHMALDSSMDDHWFGEMITEPRNEPPPVSQKPHILLRNNAVQVELLASAQLAWQHHGDKIIQVYANGVGRPFAAALIPVIEQLCCSRSLMIDNIQESKRAHTLTPLFDFLLETGAIDVR